MPEGLPIRIPHEFVNDDTVILLRWTVEEGEEVQEGQTLAEVETSKALVELAAASAGRVWHRAKPGEELRVGAVVGYISANRDSASELSHASVLSSHLDGSVGDPQPQPVAGTRFSKKAMALLETNELSTSLFSGRELVREQDVLEYLNRDRTKRTSPSGLHSALDGIPLDRLSFPSSFGDLEHGQIDAGFLTELHKRPECFQRLSSDEKIAAYRKHGAVVGDGVFFAEGSIAIAPQMVLGDRVHFGPNTSIDCRERLLVGQLTSFRGRLSVRGGTVVLGENVFGGGNVQIGGGGHADPYALLIIGDGTYIGDDVFINICRPVLIGKQVLVTQRAILVTHNIGHSILEGYENRFAAVVLEDYSQVGMNSTVYAGTRVGRGSIVMSNSYVVSSIPAGKLAAGVPARVIREAVRPLDRQRQIAIVQEMMHDYHELLARKGHAVSPLEREPFPSFAVCYRDQRFQISFLENCCDYGIWPTAVSESIIWTFQDPSTLPREGFVVFDLLAKTLSGAGGIFTESTREFLRKRGIRFEQGPWRYSGGLI